MPSTFYNDIKTLSITGKLRNKNITGMIQHTCTKIGNFMKTGPLNS